jgi:2-polyprenyl-6-methoxyphenol hydroxylase-like FAD-dependent oxidoreductase
MRHHTLASGTAVRCGTSFSKIEPDAQGVQVSFTDGRTERYDLVIGADGLMSKVREAVFPEAPKPHYTGQGSWRAVVPRPPEITRAAMYMGPTIKAGVNPISKDEMYLFVTEPRSTPEVIAESQWPETLRGLLATFGGPVGIIRDNLNAQSRIVYRPFFALLMQKPWHRGRVVLIGDAVHATTPHLASGAGIGVEDAIVLTQELERASDVETALTAFTTRRFERCRTVEDHGLLMRTTMAALLETI